MTDTREFYHHKFSKVGKCGTKWWRLFLL